MSKDIEKCPVCFLAIINTPYYKTEHGKVCEDCYEARKGEKSDYEKFIVKKEQV